MNQNTQIPKPYKPSVSPDVVKRFDEIVSQCAAGMAEVAKSLSHDLMMMEGIGGLKEIFNRPEIKELVLESAGNEAGFLCDKPNRKDKTLYTYDELMNALIPRLLEGYRLTGNEINIIAGKGMPVKRGKFRRIIELTDGFRETIGTPQEKNGFALIKCSAKWMFNGKQQSIGVDEDDPCILKIKYRPEKYDTVDKVLGLAQSKLYTRVLTRITGQFVIDEPDITDITDEVNREKMPAPSSSPPSKSKGKAQTTKTKEEKKTAPPPEEPKTEEPKPEMKEDEDGQQTFDGNRPAEEDQKDVKNDFGYSYNDVIHKSADVQYMHKILADPSYKTAIEDAMLQGYFNQGEIESVTSFDNAEKAVLFIEAIENCVG